MKPELLLKIQKRDTPRYPAIKQYEDLFKTRYSRAATVAGVEINKIIKKILNS